MNLVRDLRSDALLSRVVRNSAHLFSANSVSLFFSVVTGILAARMLGPAGYGLVGIVMSYASTINGILSFRMGELVVRYGGEYLDRGDNRRAAALIKLSAMTELAVSVVAFAAVALTAAAVARIVAKTPGATWMFVLYSIGLLCNFNTETSTGVLQITNKIRRRGTINLVQSLVSASVVGAAYIWHLRSGLRPESALLTVLLAYLLGKAILGIGLFVFAQTQVRRALEHGWYDADLSLLPPRRELFGFALSSNLSATAILIFRESEVLWVGLFLNSEAAGLYKVAYTIVGLLSVPADPLILSVYPEINRLVVKQAWSKLKGFLGKITTLAALYNAALIVGLAILGRWVLSVFGQEYVVAFPVMMVLAVGLAFNYALFWNRPLLLSFGLQNFALLAIVIAGCVKLLLAFPLVPRYGYVMEGGLLSTYYVLSVGLIVGRGLKELHGRMRLEPSQAE